MSGNTIQITPFMHVREVQATVRFFTDILGFTGHINTHDYAYIEREGAGIRIQAHSDERELGSPHRGFAYYIDVHDLDSVLQQIGPKLSELSPADVHGPVDQSYGQRELLIRAPDGNLVVFGQTIPR